MSRTGDGRTNDGTVRDGRVKVTRILHASVNVAGQLDQARRFYEGVLGMSSMDRPEIPDVPGHWYSVGDAQVHLVAAREQGGAIDPSSHHFCVAVEDLGAAIGELDDKGIPYLKGSQGEVIQIWVSDPAGNTVELQQDPMVAMQRAKTAPGQG